MGCDIHMQTEVKIGGVWHHYNEANIPRNYAFFAWLSGVRGDGSEDAVAKSGIPEDASVVTKALVDDCGVDGHTHGHVTADQIPLLEDWWSTVMEEWDGYYYVEKFWGYCFGNSWGGFVRYPEDRSPCVEDVRFIFWYDN